MDIDQEKVQDAVLALLYLTTLEDRSGLRAWKSFDWNTLDALHAKGYISNPASKAKSVVLTNEGAKRSKELCEKYFSVTR